VAEVDSPRAVRPSGWGRRCAGALWLATLGLAAAALAGVAVPPSVWLGASAALVGTVVAGVAWQGSGVFARPLVAVRTDRPELALTFDDGPDPRFTPAVLDLLEARGQNATFFVIGERAGEHRELLARIAREGHGLGNHSLRHAYTTNLLAPATLAAQLRQTSALIQDASGSSPRWFRAPVGLLSPRLARAAALAELKLVGWTATARDGVASRTVEDAVRRLTPHLRPGAILTLHDGALGTREDTIVLEVLERVLDAMAARGLRSVTLDRLLSPPSPAAGAPPPSSPGR
jgi:peptidoglycan/xylan/chitin deacetylase (PgdA/CDA1 family)